MMFGWVKVSQATAMVMGFSVAIPAHAWEFSPTPICTLSHSEASSGVKITYDHTTALYAINVTRPKGWPVAPVFSIRFDGAQPNIISTTRHQTTGGTISVSDTGFGNVLDGLEFNASATAFTGAASATVALKDAAEPVARFRSCTTAPVA